MAVYTTINDPSAHFQTNTYTGNGNNGKVITNYGNSNLQPDWVWLKSRSLAQPSTVRDSSRGTNKFLPVIFKSLLVSEIKFSIISSLIVSVFFKN